ncbi:accessory factor for bacteriocin ABC-transporter [Streptococcus infantarius subsp. infantarius]|nr:accessory factor for bacteriocin ABC-transporter [Streptococcus infantarius subsp. infantarius]MCO4550992.1 accessory factor for bacteriocin ABC-transporter [Streptococcus infantarius subsp. infantarius]MCO4554948.1 accessory factor for bacteriocin ABC-transporter [Streptococcus infantarius subsp. infantarius]MCO4557465.1 accessory factor for bacteriocin ABC-transporter [Streptococcus infantarius subsp. infantarius]MCO4562853.1 accessory factor for bacteriocin ABC-transporter [Streptococcus 
MNPKLFQSAEFYHRRYHNFATVLVIPMTLLVFFLLAFSLIVKKKLPLQHLVVLDQQKSSLLSNQVVITPF